MSQNSSLFAKVKSLILAGMTFLFPLFFLPLTQEFFVTNKLYLLAAGCLVLILISVIEFLVTKKIVWERGIFDNAFLLFIIAVALSTIITSTNKVQALLSPSFGFVMVLTLAVFYFYASRRKVELILTALYASALALSVSAIFFFLNPLQSVSLPSGLLFLQTKNFSPLGSQLDLAIFLGFVVSMVIAHLMIALRTRRSDSVEKGPSAGMRIFYMITLALSAVAFLLTLYTLYEASRTGGLILPPLRLSWYAGVEILKNPMTALFGIGVDNFPAIFTQVKDAAYNQSGLWQTSYFVVARSTFLHILSETGLLGLIAFVLLLIVAVKHIDFNKGRGLNPLLLPGLFLLGVLLLLPPSLVVFFLLVIFFSLFATEKSDEQKAVSYDVSHILPLYLSIALLGVVFVGMGSYFLGRTYLAEYKFKKALDAIAQNNARDLYVNQQNAIVLNPYIERYHINFAQTNLLLANNVAQRALQQQSGENKQATISEEDRQIIAQAVQAAIEEAKAAVALNPQKSTNWDNLAAIYRNVLTVAEGADVWTVSSYQRAIVADPQNPSYRLSLGGVYYSLNNFPEALRMFEQAVALKADWANAYYNLAWAAYQTGDYPRAVAAMQTTLTLLNPQTDKADITRAQTDLEEFKKKLPEETQEQSQGQPKELTLPTPAQDAVDPKIQLPPEASPGAQ